MVIYKAFFKFRHISIDIGGAKKNIEKPEELAVTVGAIIEKRTGLGISQRDLADMCGIPQSSVVKIETFKTIPKIDTLLKIMQPLGLKLTVSVA